MKPRPNPIRIGVTMVRSALVRAPNPHGDGVVDHDAFATVLDTLRDGGLRAIASDLAPIEDYRRQLEAIDPDELTRAEGLAFWINLYNAGALALAARTLISATRTILRMPGAFTDVWTKVAGEDLSLAYIEHGKIRRFKDPRIHSALVCGTASCPTLRFEPYLGPKADAQLDDQMRHFLSAGAAIADHESNRLSLSRVFKWYGADFARPHRMPAWIPPTGRRLRTKLRPWLEPELRAFVDEHDPEVAFQSYDWELACGIA